ncbi:MAG: hypothetical protein ACTHN5_10265 [Phycisphaerae bacterium]
MHMAAGRRERRGGGIGVCVVVAAVVVGAAGVTGARGAEELPSPADIEKNVETGKYQDALKDLTRVLALTGTPAAAYDRYTMLMLKAECMLQLKQQPGALAVLEQARKEAFAQEKPERAASPVALAFLVQHSRAFEYVPKAAGEHKAIPWLDRSRRAEAYAALLVDELPAAERKVPPLAQVKALPPLLEFAKTVGSLRALEIMRGKAGDTGEGATPETDPLVKAVGDRAAELITDAMADPSGKVLKISDTANQLVQVNVPQHDPNTGRAWVTQRMQRRGLDGEQTQYLKNVGENCGRIIAAAKEFTERLLGEDEALKGAASNAAALRMRAADLLTDNYVETTDRSERNLTTQPH